MNAIQQLVQKFNSIVSPYKPKQLVLPQSKPTTPKPIKPQPSLSTPQQTPSATQRFSPPPAPIRMPTGPAPKVSPKISLSTFSPSPAPSATMKPSNGKDLLTQFSNNPTVKKTGKMLNDVYDPKTPSTLQKPVASPKKAVGAIKSMFIEAPERAIKSVELQLKGEKSFKPTESDSFLYGKGEVKSISELSKDVSKFLQHPDVPFLGKQINDNLKRFGLPKELANAVSPILVTGALAMDLTPGIGGEKKAVEEAAKAKGGLRIGETAIKEPRTALSPEERAIHDKFSQHLANNTDQVAADYKKKYGNVINTDNVREFSQDYVKDRNKLSAAVHEPASAFAKEHYARELKNPGENVIITAGGTGAGKTSGIKAGIPEQVRNGATAILDGNLSNFDNAVKHIDLAINHGKKVTIAYVHRTPEEALVKGALPRAHAEGRTVPIEAHVNTHIKAPKVLVQLEEKYKNNPNVAIQVLDNTGAELKPGSVDNLKNLNYNKDELTTKLHQLLDNEYAKGNITKQIYEGTKRSEAPGLLGTNIKIHDGGNKEINTNESKKDLLAPFKKSTQTNLEVKQEGKGFPKSSQLGEKKGSFLKGETQSSKYGEKPFDKAKQLSIRETKSNHPANTKLSQAQQQSKSLLSHHKGDRDSTGKNLLGIPSSSRMDNRKPQNLKHEMQVQRSDSEKQPPKITQGKAQATLLETGQTHQGSATLPKSSSSEVIIPKDGKFAKSPQELNVNKLDLTTEQKAHVKSLEGTEVRQKLGDKEVVRIARDAGLDTKTYTIDQTAQKIAEQLNVRRNITSLEKKLTTATDAEKEGILKEISDSSRISRTQGTDIARQLAARRIIASELDTPLQKVFKLLDNAGVNPKEYVEKAKTVDFNNPNEVVEFYRGFVPAKARDWIDAVRYNSMLSSPRTHIVNIFSNAVNTGVVAPIEKTLTGTIDLFKSKITGEERQYYAGEGKEYMAGYYSNLGKATQKAIDVLRGKSQIANLDLERAPLATKGVKGAVAKSLEVPMKALEAADQFFMTLTESGATRALKYKIGKGAKIAEDTGVAAEAEARYRLYREALNNPREGALLRAVDFIPKSIMSARNSKNPVTRTISRFTFPFIATPTNIAKQGIEYSPAGFLTVFGSKNPTEQISKAVLGTLATAGAASLLASGRLSWAEPTDPEQKKGFRAGGKLPYSVKVGDKWISYTNLPPAISFNLAVISALDDSINNGKLDEGTVDKVLISLAKTGNFLADKTYFKQMGDLLAAIKGDPEAYSRALSNYPQQLVPLRAFGGWIARMTDEYQRKPDLSQGFINDQTQLLIQNVPGLSNTLPPRTDLNGDPIKNQYPLLNAFSPLQISKEDKNKLVQLEEAKGGISLYKYMKTMDKQKANTYYNNLQDRRPDLSSKLETFKAIDDAKLGEHEYKMVGSGIKDGTRAGLITTQLNKLNTKAEKNNYINKLYDLNIMNDDVYDQLAKLKEQGKLKAPAEKNLLTPFKN